MENGYYSRMELLNLGFASIGENVLLSKKASIYGISKIHVGSNVRIDDFCLLVGNIAIGNYVHIAAFTGLHASYGSITLDDFSCLSSQISIYAASDDYLGESLTLPMVPNKYKKIIYCDIYIGKHVLIGCGTTILPKAFIPEGVAIGAMSMVKDKLSPWCIYAGVPCRLIKKRGDKALILEKEFISFKNSIDEKI